MSVTGADVKQKNMGRRWTVEEDEGSGAGELVGIIIVVAIAAVLIFVAFWGAILFGVGYGIYRLVKYYKKQKELEPTRCPRCGKAEALEAFKTEVVKKTPIIKTIQNKLTHKAENITMTEYTNRAYEKCKFCGEITFSDTVTSSL
jgi:ribosomal protein S14